MLAEIPFVRVNGIGGNEKWTASFIYLNAMNLFHWSYANNKNGKQFVEMILICIKIISTVQIIIIIIIIIKYLLSKNGHIDIKRNLLNSMEIRKWKKYKSQFNI